MNVFIAVFASYLIVTAWLTVRREQGTIGAAEKVALVVSVTSSRRSRYFRFIAIYGFTLVLAIAALSDAKVVFLGGISGAPRIARHLWRMCVGLTLAMGSAFTNGFARLLPGRYHVPLAFFLPQFVPLALLMFWMIRVRFTEWYKGDAVASSAMRVPASIQPPP